MTQRHLTEERLAELEKWCKPYLDNSDYGPMPVDPKDVAALISDARHAERLAEAFEAIIEREDKAWKPVRISRSERDVEDDDIRHETWTEAADIARAALAVYRGEQG